jgi:hypothetical protein
MQTTEKYLKGRHTGDKGKCFPQKGWDITSYLN